MNEIDPKLALPSTGMATFMRTPFEPSGTDIDIGLVGVPYDGGGTYRPGASYGPQGVRLASTQVRLYHPTFRINPYEICKVADVGDVPFTRILEPEGAADEITAMFASLRDRGIMTLACGGDHSITYPILRAVARDRQVGLVHIDAHCDTWSEYQGTKFHNGAWVRWSIEDGLLDPTRAIQIGIRGQQPSLEGWDYPERQGIRVLPVEELDRRSASEIASEARDVVGDGPIYVSFDVDSLDPVYTNGTDTPEPGGLTVREAQALVRGLRGLDIVGADVVEPAPLLDPSGKTAHVAATMMYELLNVMCEPTAARNRQ